MLQASESWRQSNHITTWKSYHQETGSLFKGIFYNGSCGSVNYQLNSFDHIVRPIEIVSCRCSESQQGWLLMLDAWIASLGYRHPSVDEMPSERHIWPSRLFLFSGRSGRCGEKPVFLGNKCMVLDPKKAFLMRFYLEYAYKDHEKGSSNVCCWLQGQWLEMMFFF